MHCAVFQGMLYSTSTWGMNICTNDQDLSGWLTTRAMLPLLLGL